MEINKSPSVERAEEILKDPDKYYEKARVRSRDVITRTAGKRAVPGKATRRDVSKAYGSRRGGD